MFFFNVEKEIIIIYLFVYICIKYKQKCKIYLIWNHVDNLNYVFKLL